MVTFEENPQTVDALVRRLFGVNVEVDDVPQDSTMTTTPSQVLLASPSRVGFIVINLGTNAVMLWKDLTVATTKGFRIGANGGSVVLKYDEDFILPRFPWFGRTVSGTADLAVLEVKLR